MRLWKRADTPQKGKRLRQSQRAQGRETPMDGEVSLLNVGEGDIKLSFDPANLAERIRAARVVRDMLRRGFALLVEVDDGNGGKVFARAKDFDENHCVYIVADFDGAVAATEDSKEEPHAKSGQGQTEEPPATSPAAPRKGRKAGTTTKRIPAETTRAVAVGRSAGG